MSTSAPPTAAAAPRMRALRAMLAEITPTRVAIALVLAVVAALVLNHWFVTPFVVLLGRTLAIALLLLLAFAVAGRLALRGVPRWLVRPAAVVLAAPVATWLAYLPSVQGNPLAVAQNWNYTAGFLLITVAALVVAPVLAMAALYRERDAEARADALRFALEKSQFEKQALDAELRLLHAQIQPHFLFNTLANVQALVESGSPRAATVLQHLITYLSSAMPRFAEQAATLGNEVALTRSYLELMRMRMPDRLVFTIAVDDDLATLRFPSMALLTLVENAVRHGIDPAEDGGAIAIDAVRRADAVHVTVADTGAGLRDGTPPGTGLANLHARLAAFYAGGARLELAQNTPRGVRATIVVPTGAVAA